MFQCMMQLGIVAWYQLNKTYVATVLCENRDKPELKCCGKCYLRKQLKKTEDGTPETGKNIPSKASKSEIPEFITAEVFRLPVRVPATRAPYPPAGAQAPLFRPADAPFHPPAITA